MELLAPAFRTPSFTPPMTNFRRATNFPTAFNIMPAAKKTTKKPAKKAAAKKPAAKAKKTTAKKVRSAITRVIV